MVRLTQRSTILLSDSIFVFVLATAQLTAVSSPVVQRHIPWNRKARAGGVWCEAFAPQPAESQGETPPFVSLHHGMSEAFSGGCSTSMLTLPGVMLNHLSWCMIMQDSSPRPNWPRSLLRGAKAHTVESECDNLRGVVRSLRTTACKISEWKHRCSCLCTMKWLVKQRKKGKKITSEASS